jgi:hypothetical protein
LSDKKVNVSIDKSSLLAFIKNSTLIDEIEREVEKKYGCQCNKHIDNELLGGNQLIQDLKKQEIYTTKDLEKSLTKNKSKVISDQKEFIESLKADDKTPANEINFVKGAPILWLKNILSREK